MPTESWIEVDEGGERRRHVVWYADPSPERAEAVRFFEGLRYPAPRGGSAYALFPDLSLPPQVYSMTLDEANDYLRAQPIPQLYSSLTVPTPIADDDLARVRFLPELTHLMLRFDVSDAGMRHVRHLKVLEWLIVYSSKATDDCLETIGELSSLQMLDMQLSTNVSAAAFKALVKRMPAVRQSWPPWSPRDAAG